MTTYLFAVGKVESNRDIVMRPKYTPASEDAYAIGEMDGDDGQPCQPLVYFSDLASIEAYIIGWQAAQAPNGTLQRMIDEAVDDERFDGSIEDDHDWIRSGC